MKVNLTLKLSKSVIEKAKQYSEKRNLSLSKLVEEFFTLLIAEESVKNATVLPTINELAGIISEKDIVNWENGYARYLKKKYG